MPLLLMLSRLTRVPLGLQGPVDIRQELKLRKEIRLASPFAQCTRALALYLVDDSRRSPDGEVHFLTPLLFASIPASSGDHERERSRSPRRLARGDRGRRGKDKSKGSYSCGKGYAGNQKGEGKGWHAVTPDGRKICFNFNKRSGCPGHCGFVHVCRGCFGNRPWTSGKQRRWEVQRCSASGGPMTIWSE